jgi:hypothetical protein
MPDAKTLVGVQKLAALNSNTATRHVLDSGLRLTKRLIDSLSYRFSDMLEYSDMRESLMNMIGSKSVEIIDDIKDAHLHDFGIEIELHPDEEERNMLEQSIQLALQNQMIDLDDAIDIRNIRNLKLANALLKVRKNKKEVDDLKKKEANIKMQTESNIESSNAASTNQIKEMQFKMQSELEFEKQKAMLEIEKMQKKAELDMMLQKQKLEYEMMTKQSEFSQLSGREKQREDRKDQRVDKQSENQSKLIQQRKNNQPAQEFENNTQGIVDQLLS